MIILFLALQIISAITADRPVDFQIAGLYTIHSTVLGLQCDTLMADHVVLSEAQNYAVDYANKNILSQVGLVMGETLADTCNDRSVTLQETVDMIKSAKGFCVRPKTVDEFNSTVIALLGSFNCDLAENIDYLLQAFCIPVISSACTSSVMDDTELFPYFARTTASDSFRAQVMYDVLLSQEFYHISIVYDASAQGQALKEAFINLMYYCTDNINQLFRPPCIEDSFELSFFKSDAPLKNQLDVFKESLSQSQVRVFVVFMDTVAISSLMSYLEAWGYQAGDFQFILPTIDLDTTLSSVYEYSFAVDAYSPPVPHFEKQLRETQIQDTQNDYLKEMIATDNKCCPDDLLEDHCPFSIKCKGTETLRGLPGGARRARHVIDSVTLVAETMVTLHLRYCNVGEGICEKFLQNFNGAMFFEEMQRTSFLSINSNETFLTLNGSGIPVYDIFQRYKDDWIPVLLHYNPLLGPEPNDLNNEPYEIPSHKAIRHEIDTCQEECVRQFLDIGKGCCWTCRDCPRYSFINETTQRCYTCPNTLIPNDDLTGCMEPPQAKHVFLKPTTEIKFMLAIAIIGILLTLPALAVLILRRNTPMVRAATPDLAYTQSAIVLGLFATASFMIPSSRAFICGTTWAISALLLTSCHSVFLVKALRISRPDFFVRLISTMKTPAKASALIEVVTFGIQLFIVVIWLVLRPPTIKYNRDTSAVYCTSNNEGQTSVLLFIPIGLLCVTLVFQKRGCGNQFIYQVHQARMGLAGSLCFIVNYAVLIPLIFIEESTQQVKSVVLMCIPLLTGWVSWLMMLLPTTYELLAKAKVNSQEYVTRQQSRQFQQGNVMYYIESIVFNRPKGHTVNSTTSGDSVTTVESANTEEDEGIQTDHSQKKE